MLTCPEFCTPFSVMGASMGGLSLKCSTHPCLYLTKYHANATEAVVGIAVIDIIVAAVVDLRGDVSLADYLLYL